MLIRLIWHWLVLALGLYVVTLITPLGITYNKPSDLAWAAFVLIIFNTFVKPVLILFTLPLVLLSLGLFLFVINGVLLYWLPHFVHGFHVPGFWSAFFGALVLTVITSVFSGYEKQTVRRRRVNVNAPQQGKVIDI